MSLNIYFIVDLDIERVSLRLVQCGRVCLGLVECTRPRTVFDSHNTIPASLKILEVDAAEPAAHHASIQHGSQYWTPTPVEHLTTEPDASALAC